MIFRAEVTDEPVGLYLFRDTGYPRVQISHEMTCGTVVDLDAHGNVVGLEPLGPTLDLRNLLILNLGDPPMARHEGFHEVVALSDPVSIPVLKAALDAASSDVRVVIEPTRPPRLLILEPDEAETTDDTIG